MNQKTIQVILNQMHAIHGGCGGYGNHFDDTHKTSKPIKPKKPRIDRTKTAQKTYYDALLKIGKPVSAEDLARATGKKSTTISSFGFNNPDFFIKTRYKDENNRIVCLYWINGLAINEVRK